MAFLATRANAPILPVAIQGTPGVLKKPRPRVSVTVGPLFTLDTAGAKPTRDLLTRLTDDAMRKLAALLPQEMRGAYAG